MRVIIPHCYSNDRSVGGNRFQQLLVASQEVEIEDPRDGGTFAVVEGAEYSLVRRSTRRSEPQMAVIVPKSADVLEGLPLPDEARWVGDRSAYPVDRVLDSLRDSFTFVVEEKERGINGLRPPQIGALHAVLGYWTTDPREPATVVMPTGTGKTDTMIALWAHERIPLLLIVVPSDALRDQLAGKFESLNVLLDSGVLGPHVTRPVVGKIKHGFKSVEDAITFADACNVIVATPAVLSAGDADARKALLDRCSHLFVDEAHHVSATTWRTIRDHFAGASSAESPDRKPVVQFTATPFRADGRHLGGRLVYAFPLREAQRQGYFSKISYQSVFDFDDPDRAIAEAAIGRLRADAADERVHLLMARVRSISRATALLPLYEELAPEFRPRVIHSRLSAADRQESLTAIEDGSSRIVICVNMLGEGYDLPQLKVAALHDPHKTLGITLQFVGRFTRAFDEGAATVVVSRSEDDYDEVLRKLYSEDPDWNLIVRELSESAVGAEQDASDFEAAFGSLPEEIRLRSLAPKMGAEVFQVDTDQWHPEKVVKLFGEEAILTLPIPVNERDRIAWFVTESREEVRWGEIKSLEEINHGLVVLHWDEEQKLLFINSSDTGRLHEDIAKTVCGPSAAIIRGEQIYRAMGNLTRPVPVNIGLLDVRDRGRHFSMFAGANVTEGLTEAETSSKTKTNIFVFGYENGERVGVGMGAKGRIWSHRLASSLKGWAEWCQANGRKLLDPDIHVEEVIKSVIRPEVLTSRPELYVLAAEWPWDLLFSTSETHCLKRGETEFPLFDTDLEVETNNQGPIKFRVVTPEWEAPYQAEFTESGVEYRALAEDVLVITSRSEKPLTTFLQGHGMTFFLEQDAIITHPGTLLRPNLEIAPYDKNKIQIVDWTGIDPRRESQGRLRDQTTVQARMIEHVRQAGEWDVALDDDGSGEIADIVALRIEGDELQILLVHCKFATSLSGRRIDDLYQVCGQAQKSARYREKPTVTLRKLVRRERQRQRKHGYSGYLWGTAEDLQRIQEVAPKLTPQFTICIAQPGLSQSNPSDDQLALLASTELFVSQTANARFEVFGSH